MSRPDQYPDPWPIRWLTALDNWLRTLTVRPTQHYVDVIADVDGTVLCVIGPYPYLSMARQVATHLSIVLRPDLAHVNLRIEGGGQ